MEVNIFQFLFDFFEILINLASNLWAFCTSEITIFGRQVVLYQFVGTTALISIVIIVVVKKIIL